MLNWNVVIAGTVVGIAGCIASPSDGAWYYPKKWLKKAQELIEGWFTDKAADVVKAAIDAAADLAHAFGLGGGALTNALGSAKEFVDWSKGYMQEFSSLILGLGIFYVVRELRR